MGAFESGQTFIAGVLAKLPANLQEQAKKIFEAAEAKDAVTVIGDSTLARSDYSRQMDDLRQKEESIAAHQAELNSWFTNNKGALEEYVKIKPEYDTLKGSTPNPNPAAPAKVVVPFSEEDARKVAAQAIDEAGRDYVQIAAWISSKAVWHLHTFGEPLPGNEIASNPKLGRPIAGTNRVFTLEDAYNEKYHEKLAAKTKDTEDKRIETEVQRRLGEERTKHGNHPFPLRGEASVLDAMNDPNNKPGTYTLDTAVAEYDRLQSQRQG